MHVIRAAGSGNRRVVVLTVALILIQVLVAARALPAGLGALVGDPSSESPLNAIDLRLRLVETQLWFRGEPVYVMREDAVYPPGAYPVLWLAVGWMPIEHARFLWAALSLVCVATLGWQMARLAGMRAHLTSTIALALALVPAAMLATRICLGLGQMSLVVISATVGGVLLLTRLDARLGWPGRIVGVALILVGLAKPSLSLPFMPLLLWRADRRTLSTLAVSYVALSLLAWSAQSGNASLVTLLLQWQHNSAGVVSSNQFGYANIHWWLSERGLAEFNTIASLLLLGVLVVISGVIRRAPLSRAIAICALVARLWTYHSSYDDLLIAIVLAALAGETIGALSGAARALAALLWMLNWLAGLDGLQALLHQWSPVSFSDVMGGLWICTLIYFLAACIRIRAAGELEPENDTRRHIA
jgi:hypothetical protein